MVAKVPAIAGVAMAVLGVVISLSIIPSLSVSCGSSPCVVVWPSFTYTVSGDTVVLTDTSTESGPAGVQFTVSWGDGSPNATFGALHFSATHAYAPPAGGASATFTITETVHWTAGSGPPGVASASSTVTVPASGGGGSGGGGGGAGGSSFWSWSFLSGLLLVGGASTAIAAVAISDPRAMAAAAAGGALIGGVVGLGLGGMAWL